MSDARSRRGTTRPSPTDNPGVTLPSTAITVVHRSDGSGTTNQFTHYLTLAATKTAWTLGTGDTVNWPSSTKAGNGNAGVAQAIQSTTGAIGYVDFSDAVASKLTFASIKNKSGTFVAPSLDAASAAVATATVNANLTYVALNSTGADAYPITAGDLRDRVPEADGRDDGQGPPGLAELPADRRAGAWPTPNNYAKLPSTWTRRPWPRSTPCRSAEVGRSHESLTT